MNRRPLASCALMWLMFAAMPAWAAPGNDNLGGAPTITAIPYRDTRSTAGATVQTGERTGSCAPAKATLWYEVRLAQTTPVSVSTYGSSFDTTLTVWQATSRSFTAMTILQCNNDMGTRTQSMVGWVAEAGVRYLVQAGGAGTALTGTLRLRITYGARPDKPDQEVGPQSTAATIAVAADEGGIDAGMRVRESVCLFGFCVPVAEVQADTRLLPTLPPQDAVEGCVRFIAILVLVIERCGPV